MRARLSSQVVRHRPPSISIILGRRYPRHRVLRPFQLTALLHRAIATEHHRRGARDRPEHTIPAVLDAGRHAAGLVAKQARVVALW